MKILSVEQTTFLAQSQVWQVESSSGRRYQVTITPPVGQPTSDTALRGILSTDGEMFAGLITGAVKALSLGGEVSPSVVVTVGYPEGLPVDWQATRARDLTPSEMPAFDQVQRERFGESTPGSGEAEAFLGFLNQELKPAVEERFSVDSRAWTLSGASLGGLFAVWTLLSRPESFVRYNVISPSLWWNDGELWAKAQDFAAQPMSMDAAIHISCGDLETSAALDKLFSTMPVEQAQSWIKSMGGRTPDMVADAKQLSTILQGRKGLRVGHATMPNESHTSVVGVALSQGLRWLEGQSSASAMNLKKAS